LSLKAKIEAVIYASEEPVTLAQLVGLLGQEGQAELDRLDDRQQTLGLVGGGEGGSETESGVAAGEDAAEESETEGQEMGQAEASASEGDADSSAALRNDNQDELEPEAADAAEAPAASVAADSAAEKRVARERERRLREFFREILDELIREYATGDRGLEVRELAGGFRMGTKPEYHDAVRGFVRSLKPPLRLSLQALETLAVVAYKQPVTAPEVSEIRGVDSGGVLGSLMGRKLISTAGRKQVIGRPILYKTTKDFLLRFGLKDISELPSIEEFEKMAGDLAEQEEIPMPQGSDTKDTAEERITHENLQEEKNAVEPQADGDSDSLEPDDSNRPADEVPAVDGRLAGLPPTYDRPGDDPSADEAAIQSGEGE
jgi:segregation and condensation protein B